jgi:hypothetical protein
MINQNPICAERIGEETLLQSIMKMTAPCWTRCIYRYPPLAHQAWIYWEKLRKDENENYTDELPNDLPKNWRKYPNICKDIVMACPFCTYTYSENIRKGKLEHLHLYCSSKHLKKARYHCYQKIEDALHNIYNFASMLEYNCPFDESTRYTTLF